MWDCDIRARKPQASHQRALDRLCRQSCPHQVEQLGFDPSLTQSSLDASSPKEECEVVQQRQIQKELTAKGCLLILPPRARQRFLP